MGAFSVTHLLIVLIIVVLVFGTSRIKSIGSDLGSAVKNFKKGLSEEDDDENNSGKSPNKKQTIQ